MLNRYLLMLSCLFIVMGVLAQDAVYKDSIAIMAMGPNFKASKWKMLWWGKHYRDDWTVPVEFKVLDLDKTAGGLKPIKKGGGHETKSLRLLGANGKEYVLRTIDKDLSPLVPENFKGSFINDIVNDQVCTAHPYGPPIVAQLAGAAGIMHTNPVIIFVPCSSRLGEYQTDFANTLCLFEERVSGKGWDRQALTGNAIDIINTEKLLERLKNNPNSKVDQQSFLRVRLFDIFINDWDRHEDQWVWTEHQQNGKIVYRAFARDRDQSFSRTDGIYLYLLSRRWALPLLQNMDDKVNNIIGETLEGRFLDKTFLNELSEVDWKAVIAELQGSLTDTAIENAVHALPFAMQKISGEFLEHKLKSRRDDMMRFGLAYYSILNHQVDIVGTDKQEHYFVNVLSDELTEITVRRIGKDNHDKDTIFHRLFETSITKRIYLFGLSGDDIFSISGSTKPGPRISIIGGPGNDSYLVPNGHFPKSTFHVYEGRQSSIVLDRSYRSHFTNDSLLTKYNRKHFFYDWYAPLVVPGFNVDDGVFIGAGFTYKKRSWEKNPYTWQQTFGAAAAFKTGATNFFYTGKFNQFIGKWALRLHVHYKGPQFIMNYYGYGNESKQDSSDNAYYRVKVKHFIANPSFIRNVSNQAFRIGLIYEQLELDKNNGRFIEKGTAGVNSNVFYPNTFLGVDFNYIIGRKDNTVFPKKGYFFQSTIMYKVNVTEHGKDFLQLSSSFNFYWPLGPFVLAHRSAVATNIGKFEFYHANTIGGVDNLRGFNRTRFTGKTAFYQNTELRCPFGELKGYVLKGRVGMLAFFDNGRVWMNDEPSNKLHTNIGGGFFFTPFNSVVLNLSYSRSVERGLAMFSLDFQF